MLLQQAQQDAGSAQEQVGGLLVEELVADADHEGVLIAALDLVEQAPIAACHALTHLRDNVRPAQLPNAARLLLERDWVAFARRADAPQPVRADVLAAVAELLQEHQYSQESADLLRALPREFNGDLRLQLLLGTALVALRQWPAAQEALTHAVQTLLPATPPELAEDIRFTAAALHERVGEVNESLALLDPEATTSPATRARCLALRALCLVQTGQTEQAQEERAAAEGLAPEAETVVVMGTWVLLGAGEFHVAADRAAEGLRRHPESNELSFLRSQTKIAAGDDVASQTRRVRRLVERLDQADLAVLVNRTRRVRPEADASLHYFLALVERAAGRDDEALVNVGKVVAGLGAGDGMPRLSELTVAARRLRAELLEDRDPAGAATEYAAAGNDAFDLEDWNTTVDLLSRARRLGALDQLGHWNLAEAYFLTSFAISEPMGLSENQLRQAVETWNGAFAEQLPDVDTGWAYVSRARMEMRLARLARRSPERALRSLLYCECGIVLSAPALVLLSVYNESTHALGLYALGAELQQLGLETEPADVETLQRLIVSAANGGDLRLMREYLPRLERTAANTSWHTEAARLYLLAEDPRTALDELAQVSQGDRAPLYFEWHELLAHARLEEADGVAATLERAREHLEEAARGAPAEPNEPDIGLQVCFRFLLGEPEAAASLLERMADEDSWWTDVALDAALTGMLRGTGSAGTDAVSSTAAEADGTHEAAVHQFLERTRSIEDVGQLNTLLGELRALTSDRSRYRPVDGLDAALARLLDHARERLERGGWPVIVDADLASLLDRPWSPEQQALARATKAAIAARRAMYEENWQGAIEGYRSLLTADGGFPEAEQGLVQVAARAIERSLDDDSSVLADAVRRLMEALPCLSGVRRRPSATDLLEVWLGDACIHILRDLDGARVLYEAAVGVVGRRAAGHVVDARLHVGAALLERPADGPGLDAVLESCRESGASAVQVVIDAAAALVRSAAGWQRLVDIWEGLSARLAASVGPEDSYQIELLLVEATAQAGLAWRQEGDLGRAQANLRRAFERHRDLAGPDDPDVLARRNSLAVVLAEEGRFADAEVELRSVIDGRTRELRQDDEETLSARLDLGKVLFEQGRPAEAEVEFRLVADSRGRLLGEDNTATWDARYSVARALQEQGRLDEAEQAFREVLEADRRLRGAQTADTLSTRFGLAQTLVRLGRFAEAGEEYRDIVADRVRSLGADDPATLTARYNLAAALRGQGDLEAAEREYREVLAAEMRVQGAEDPSTLITQHELAAVLRELGRLAEAEVELRAVVEGRTRALGADDPATLAARYNLATVLREQGDLESAEREYRAVSEARMRQLGEDDVTTLTARFELAMVLRDQGRYAEAEVELGAVVEGRTRALGADDPATLAARYTLATALQGQGDLEAAEREYRAVLAAETRVQGAEDPSTTLITQHELAAVLRELGRLAEAEVELRAVVEGRTRALGADDPTTLAARYNLATALREQGDLEAAEREYRAVLAAETRLQGAEDPSTLITQHALAAVLRELGRLAEAEVELRAVVEGRTRALGADDPTTLAARFESGLLLLMQGNVAEAEVELAAVVEDRTRVFGADDPATLTARYNLAAALRGRGDLEAAEREYRAVLAAETRVQGAEDPSTLITQHELAAVLGEQGRLAEAEVELRAVVEGRTRALGADDPATLTAREEHTAVLRDLAGSEREDPSGSATLQRHSQENSG